MDGGTTSDNVINQLKSIFAKDGIFEQLRSDCCPQFLSTLFVRFAEQLRFGHRFSSLWFSQSIGETQRAVQMVKNLLQKPIDPYLALLAYCATPLQSRYSPSKSGNPAS